eukprot:2400850-Rhodomonas_salina.2
MQHAVTVGVSEPRLGFRWILSAVPGTCLGLGQCVRYVVSEYQSSIVQVDFGGKVSSKTSDLLRLLVAAALHQELASITPVHFELQRPRNSEEKDELRPH